MPEPGQLALLIPIFAMCIPITALVSKHFKDMAEIEARKGSAGSAEVREQLAAIRAEIAELRDTTTRFDMSFDAAITRLEQRVDHLEEEQPASITRVTAPVVEERETVRVGRKR